MSDRAIETLASRAWQGVAEGDVENWFAWMSFLFKGPDPVDSLLRVPLIWRPAPSAAVDRAVVPEPLGRSLASPADLHPSKRSCAYP